MFATFASIVVGGYMAIVGGMYVFQRSLLYVPDVSETTPAANGAPEMSVVTTETADGLSLANWYRPAAGDNRRTIVYLQGNGGHLGYRSDRVRPYLDAGYGVFMVGYRGYGGNPGKPTEVGLYEDAGAALRFLMEQGVPPSRTVLYGESLGTGVAVHVAREQAVAGKPVSAVVLEAPLSSAVDVGAHHYPLIPVRWLMKDRFDSKTKIGDIRAPLFIVHGTEDQVVPMKFGELLFEAAAEPKNALWIKGAGHGDLDRFGMQQAVIGFLERGDGKEE
ncbi:MAG: alpha/beta hydrolase [Rhodospirillales bacterium]|nr:alpha/beta hydrolase [Rhodospirillales bacterium]